MWRITPVLLALAASPAMADQVRHAPPWLPSGACDASLVVESNLSIREEGEPVSLAPDLSCGLPGRLTVGVLHSNHALSRIDSGNGLCLDGDTCERAYDGGAIDLRRGMSGGDAVQVAARLRLVARSLEPFKPSARLGALVRFGRRGRASLLADPHLSFGLANQELGNRDFVALPLYLQLRLGRTAIELVSGVRGEVLGWSEKFQVPLGLGLHVELGSFEVGLEAAFPRLLGPQNNFKQRHGALVFTYRFASGPPPPPARSYTAR